MKPVKTKFFDLSFEDRFWAYLEICSVSLAVFLYVAGITVIALLIWTKWADQEFKWEIALVVGIVGLLPYLVIAAVVWRVNLNLFGRVSAESIPNVGDQTQGIRGNLENL